MTRFARILAVMMLVATTATTGYAQGGAMSPVQMRMMSDHMKMMSDQMKAGKMTPDQMKMMGEHMQMMADRMKSGQMAPDDARAHADDAGTHDGQEIAGTGGDRLKVGV